MLTHPWTPPQDHLAEAIDSDNGASVESNPYFAPFPPLITTPTSVAGMGFDGLDDRSDIDDRQDSSQDLSDEDLDMSDGGAALALTLSHAEELNAEMDMLDAEVMGADNLVGLFLDAHFQTTSIDDMPFTYSDSPEDAPPPDQNPVALGDDVIYHGFMHEIDTPDLPIAMSEVSQQLQHIQDGQEHEEIMLGLDEQHGAFTDNSTTPFLLPSLSSAGVVSSGEVAQPDFVSMADISSFNLPLASVGSQNAPHLWSSEGWTPAPDMDVLVPTHGVQMTSHFPSSDMIWDDDLVSEADQIEVEDQFNLSLGDFLYNWGMLSARDEEQSKKRSRGPILPAIHKQRFVGDLEPIEQCDLLGERCDIQRIDWMDLGVSRLEAKQRRRQTYKNYTNLRVSRQWHPRLNGARLSDNENYFKFRRMDFDQNIHLSHFQLRNLMTCTTRDQVFYAGRSKIHRYNHSRGTKSSPPNSVVMDLTEPTVQPFHAFPGGIQISTVAAAHDILIAGGFSGEYGMINLRAHKSTKHTEGLITNHVNSITNHIQVHLSRSSSLPLAAFASNDCGLRILDINTNKCIAEHKFEHAINCSAISPDQRLRVLVGDRRKVMICNAETGEVLQELEGHRDYGFACDWADDGWTVATGNQDMQVKIWDARKWTTSQGIACPISTIAAEIAGVRKLKFSPLGSGKRVLLTAEPADFISLIDAETFASKQTLSFFGEVGGVDFTDDGQDLIIANCDNMRGGLMEFERCGLASEGRYGLERHAGDERHTGRSMGRSHGYDWTPMMEDIVNHPKSKGTAMFRERKAAMLGSIPHF